jgi:hypothetical protein
MSAVGGDARRQPVNRQSLERVTGPFVVEPLRRRFGRIIVLGIVCVLSIGGRSFLLLTSDKFDYGSNPDPICPRIGALTSAYCKPKSMRPRLVPNIRICDIASHNFICLKASGFQRLSSSQRSEQSLEHLRVEARHRWPALDQGDDIVHHDISHALAQRFDGAA